MDSAMYSMDTAARAALMEHNLFAQHADGQSRTTQNHLTPCILGQSYRVPIPRGAEPEGFEHVHDSNHVLYRGLPCLSMQHSFLRVEAQLDSVWKGI